MVPRLRKSRDRPALRRLVVELDEFLVDIAPAPAFRRVVAFDDRVAGGAEMLGGVAVGRIITAADVAAGSAEPQMQPRAIDLEAFLAAQRTRRHIADGFAVWAGARHG